MIPKEMREKGHLQPDDRIKLINIDREIVIKLEKQEKKAELRALELLKKAKLNEKDWQEILRMRKRE